MFEVILQHALCFIASVLCFSTCNVLCVVRFSTYAKLNHSLLGTKLKRIPRLLDMDTVMRKTPWDVLFILGGGYAIAAGCSVNTRVLYHVYLTCVLYHVYFTMCTLPCVLYHVYLKRVLYHAYFTMCT